MEGGKGCNFSRSTGRPSLPLYWCVDYGQLRQSDPKLTKRKRYFTYAREGGDEKLSQGLQADIRKGQFWNLDQRWTNR